MRHYRRNADEGLRSLGRAAAAGDPEAALLLVRRLIGSGQSVDVGPLAQAGPRAVRLLPERLKSKLVSALMVDADVRWLEQRAAAVGGRSGSMAAGWFPDHRRQDVCPRGHRIGGGNPFIFRNVGAVTEWVYVYNADAGELFAGQEWDTEHVDGTGAGHVLCTECSAAWPAARVSG